MRRFTWLLERRKTARKVSGTEGTDIAQQQRQATEKWGRTQGCLTANVFNKDTQRLQELHFDGLTRFLVQDCENIGQNVLLQEKSSEELEQHKRVRYISRLALLAPALLPVPQSCALHLPHRRTHLLHILKEQLVILVTPNDELSNLQSFRRSRLAGVNPPRRSTTRTCRSVSTMTVRFLELITGFFTNTLCKYLRGMRRYATALQSFAPQVHSYNKPFAASKPAAPSTAHTTAHSAGNSGMWLTYFK